MKKSVAIIWLILLFSGIAVVFWHSEWVYSLPTPVPENHKAVDLGEVIDVTGELKSNNNKPIFLHFFNPDCPCSRFNIPHFKSLVKQYGNDVTFVIVPLIKSGQHYTDKEIQDKFGLTIPVLNDGAIAALCGVYSTPQAVIVEANHKLYYRGNYNKSRYCTDKKSNYAQIALESMLHESVSPIFSP